MNFFFIYSILFEKNHIYIYIYIYRGLVYHQSSHTWSLTLILVPLCFCLYPSFLFNFFSSIYPFQGQLKSENFFSKK